MARSTRAGINQRGAVLVEYALLVALIAVALIVSINFLGGKLGDTFARASTEVGSTSALPASDTTGSGGTSGSSGNGSSGSGAGATTTTVAPTTTTVAVTTTVAPTTTTVAVTTTTAASEPESGSGQGSTPDQSKTAAYKHEFQITFGAFGDTISVTGVDADDWTYEIVENVHKKLKVKFTSADGDDVVLVEAKIDKKGKLKTKVKTLNNRREPLGSQRYGRGTVSET